MYLWDATPITMGKHNGFVGCQIRLDGNRDFVLSGEANYATDCGFSFGGSGRLVLSGKYCRAQGCAPIGSGNFSAAITGLECIAVGNVFTAPPADDGQGTSLSANCHGDAV